MASAPVVNASPLILLSRIRMTDVLCIGAQEVVVPRAVASEVLAYGNNDPTALAMRDCAWLVVRDIDVMPLQIAQWDLGKGESEVLAWAMAHPGTVAIVDDLSARRCATTLGIPVRGTVGLVLNAKRTGRIPAVRPVFEQLASMGMYLSPKTLDQSSCFARW